MEAKTSGVYNSFELKFHGNTDINRIKKLVENTIRKNNYKLYDILVWEELEVSGNKISAEEYLGFEYEDFEASKDLFIQICKSIINESPDQNFMGKYAFDYSNVDHSDRLFCFYKDMVFLVYEGGTDDGEAYLTNQSRYEFSAGKLSGPIVSEYEDKQGTSREQMVDAVWTADIDLVKNIIVQQGYRISLDRDEDDLRSDLEVEILADADEKGILPMNLFISLKSRAEGNNDVEEEFEEEYEDYDEEEDEFSAIWDLYDSGEYPVL